MRVAAAVDALVSTLAVALIAVAVALTLHKVAPGFSARSVIDVMVAAALAAVAAAVYAAMRRLPKLAGAMALDAHHGLSDRLASALAFTELRSAERTRLMELAIDDACAKANRLSPRHAVPFRWPRDLGAMLGLLGGVLLLAWLHPKVPAPFSQAKTIEPVVLAADDIDLFREVGKKLAEKDKSPEALAALKAYNQLIEDLAQKRLDRTDAFKKLAEIQEHLAEASALDAKSLEEQLKMRARALKNSSLAKPLADALEQQDLAKAEQKMRELAQRLRDKPDSVAKADLERLRDAMKNASEGQKERLAALEHRRDELREELLAKREQNKDAGPRDQEEERLLHKKERELERLDREQDQKKSEQSRQLDKLDRDIAQAAEDIMRELGASSNDLDQGAEDINRIAREQMSQQEREELRQKLEELREQLRQSGQAGRERMARLRRFSRQARGEGQGQGGKPKPCAAGDTNCQDGQESGQGEDGESQGSKQGESSGDMLQIGPGGDPMLELSQGQQGQGRPGGQGQGPDQGEGQGPNIKGPEQKTNRMPTQDVQAAGLDTGQGPSRSQVILGAAEKGFRGGSYKKVYTEYRTSAEEQMHEDKVPPGGSEHIRRYFDLIRPRE
jgi:hypothetical protein